MLQPGGDKINKKIRLEMFDQTCFDVLISWVDTPELLMQFAGPLFTFPLTKEQLEKTLNDKNRYSFKVIDEETTHYIGHAEIYVSENSAYLGRILIGNTLLRGQGRGKAIVRELLAYALFALRQTKVELNVFDWNTVAIKCYQNTGFRIHPDKRTERKFNGETWNVVSMYIDKNKWEQSL